MTFSTMMLEKKLHLSKSRQIKLQIRPQGGSISCNLELKTFNIIFEIEDDQTDKLLYEGRETQTEKQRGFQESEKHFSCTGCFAELF